MANRSEFSAERELVQQYSDQKGAFYRKHWEHKTMSWSEFAEEKLYISEGSSRLRLAPRFSAATTKSHNWLKAET